ncbi:MAG: hypothetical protein AAGB18_03220, partial [Pseudomonadota bacterium]
LGAGLVARLIWQAGAVALVYEAGVLREEAPDGRVLASLGDIKGVDRGAFAFKPSNGFLLRLHDPGVRAWVPGVWWRSGRYLGVGGLLPASETRAVAEAISLGLVSQGEPK